MLFFTNKHPFPERIIHKNLNIKPFKVKETEFSGITKHYYASPCLKTKTGRFKKSNKSFESNDFIERKG